MLSSLNPDPDLSTPGNIDAAIEKLNKEMHNAAEFANPPPPTTPRTPARDLHLWSPEIAADRGREETPQTSMVPLA
ncbi:hypothetical protein A7M48_19615 [Acinetobacter baumannii]|nr:hypothetical protein A7M48_19615 [Acinetobacter baumannii]